MSKPIVISDDAVVNEYGFRVLSDGCDLSLYDKNPILLYDHSRKDEDDKGSKDVILPIGTLTDVKRVGSQWIGTPVFDLEDEFAAEIARKYDKGIFNMASIGFRPLEWSEDPALMLAGQTGPTITKWVLKETSITDIGANYNCTKILSATGAVLNLSANTTPQDIKEFLSSSIPQTPNHLSMKKVISALNGSKLVTLSDASSEELVAEGVTTLIHQLSTKQSTIEQLNATIATMKENEKNAAFKVLADRALALVEGALSAQKIVAAQKENLVKLASQSEESFNSTKSFLDSLTGYKPVSEQLGSVNQKKTELELKKEYDEHIKNDTLTALRDENLDHFKKVYKAGTGKEYKS